MDRILQKVNSGDRLSFNEARDLFESMMQGSLAESQIASSLIAMKLRGETVDELAALAVAMNRNKRAFTPGVKGTIDTCGTGGDGKSTVNVSTAVAIIIASMGYPVVKHGNYAQSGIVGSADILSDLGVDINGITSPEEYLARHNFIYMLAPLYHPALRGIGKVRRELKVPTLFNLAGPLANPADPDYQIIGISRRGRLEFMAGVLEKIGRKNITLYSSRDGYDEVSSANTTECIHIGEGDTRRFTIDPSDFFEPFPMPVVRDRDDARHQFLDGLTGRCETLMKVFALNAALALRTMNCCGMREGFFSAREQISSGRAISKLEELASEESAARAAQ
ncbi:MAG TPA: anthranilate phosphoribosyltransferase [Spirochaetota bacterium]|nr:anthranilate phosphoribosyltransferase [Spirochaetota bacterium]HQL82114.1 anthranilate phosphoribosyltransferase [Spirochaetota bacterium]